MARDFGEIHLSFTYDKVYSASYKYRNVERKRNRYECHKERYG